MQLKKYYIISVIIILSLFLITLCFIKKTIFNGYVTVKGSSEKNVKADIASWSIYFTNSGNDIKLLKEKNQQDLSIIFEFLKNNNIKDSEIKILPIDMYDSNSDGYSNSKNNNRYIITNGVSITTKNVDIIENLAQRLDELIYKNISIKNTYENYNGKPVYKFTKLNEIKQDMIKEATLNAKKSAEQFAKDSNTKVGKIKYANQGTFSINCHMNNDYDSYNEYLFKEKQVRAVVTIQYWLK